MNNYAFYLMMYNSRHFRNVDIPNIKNHYVFKSTYHQKHFFLDFKVSPNDKQITKPNLNLN